jgi:hypothetical protein
MASIPVSLPHFLEATMQDAQIANSWLPSVATRVQSSVVGAELPYRRQQTVCSDRDFVSLLNAYRASGGLASAEELLVPSRERSGPDVSTLARWIVARQVISFGWQARTWLPMFQFEPGDMTPRRDLAPVIAELSAVYDECQLVTWFVASNESLDGRSPVQVFTTCAAEVERAARIDRFVADA